MANTLATLRSRAYTLQLRPLTVCEVKEILDKNTQMQQILKEK